MPLFEIVEAKPSQVGAIARRLRDEHRNVLLGLGSDKKLIYSALSLSFAVSDFRRAWLIDGELAALGGVHGNLISSQGVVWLALSQEATRYPVSIVKEARKQIAEIMRSKNSLITSVFSKDETAFRFAKFLGFRMIDSSFPEEVRMEIP